MGLFQTYISPSLPRGVYAVSTPPPATITPTGTGNSIAVGQFPWGPTEKLTYPGSVAAFWQTFAPAGMTRTGSAHLSTIRKGWPQLGGVRVADATAVAASCSISTSAPAVLFVVNALYSGTNGNSIIATVGAASDGVTGHWNLTVQVSSASGTTTEIYPNNNLTGTGADVLPNVAGSILLASVTKSSVGTPVNGSTTLSGGTNGTVTAAMYVGTPGGNDNGFALLEADNTIDGVFTDDSGSFRTAVNTGLSAHAQLTTDRIAYLNGPSGQTASAAQTDVATYRSINCVYVDPWAYVSDDTTGALSLQPGSSWAASVAAQIPPSVSISWRAQAITSLLAGISSLEFNRSGSRAQNTASGIATLIKGAQGGYCFEAGVNTSLVAGQINLTRTRMGIYIARSAVNSWYPYVDAPNVTFFQQDLSNSAFVFLNQLVVNAKVNPAVLPYIVAFDMPRSALNTAAYVAAGGYDVAANIQIGANMSRISLSMNYGESVTISTT
jgi:hypothetical protein